MVARAVMASEELTAWLGLCRDIISPAVGVSHRLPPPRTGSQELLAPPISPLGFTDWGASDKGGTRGTWADLEGEATFRCLLLLFSQRHHHGHCYRQNGDSGRSPVEEDRFPLRKQNGFLLPHVGLLRQQGGDGGPKCFLKLQG